MAMKFSYVARETGINLRRNVTLTVASMVTVEPSVNAPCGNVISCAIPDVANPNAQTSANALMRRLPIDASLCVSLRCAGSPHRRVRLPIGSTLGSP